MALDAVPSDADKRDDSSERAAGTPLGTLEYDSESPRQPPAVTPVGPRCAGTAAPPDTRSPILTPAQSAGSADRPAASADSILADARPPLTPTQSKRSSGRATSGPCLSLLQDVNERLEAGGDVERLGFIPLEEQDSSVTFFDSRPSKGGWIRFSTTPPCVDEDGRPVPAAVFYRSNGQPRPPFRRATYSCRRGDPPYIDFPDIRKGVLLPAAPHAHRALLTDLARLFTEAGVEHNLPLPPSPDQQAFCSCAVM